MKIKKLANFIILPIILGVTCLAPIQYASADNICGNEYVSEEIKAASGCPGDSSNGDVLPTVVINIINAVISISGLVAVVFIVVGGIQYMTSSGDAGKVKKAKDTILYALVGLVICVLAFAIVNWTAGAINNASNQTSNNNSTNNNP